MVAKYWPVALIVLVMGGSGVYHLVNPGFYTCFVFWPLPPVATVVRVFVQVVFIWVGVMLWRRGSA